MVSSIQICVNVNVKESYEPHGVNTISENGKELEKLVILVVAWGYNLDSRSTYQAQGSTAHSCLCYSIQRQFQCYFNQIVPGPTCSRYGTATPECYATGTLI